MTLNVNIGRVIYTQYSRNELAHFGVLGMRWGKRKGKSSNSSNQPKPSKHYDSLVSKYSQKGYSPQEAARRAKNRIRAEKTLLAPILREHGHGANRFGFRFESLKDDSLIGIFDRQLARNRKRRK